MKLALGVVVSLTAITFNTIPTDSINSWGIFEGLKTVPELLFQKKNLQNGLMQSMYTIRPIQEAIDYNLKKQFEKNMVNLKEQIEA